MSTSYTVRTRIHADGGFDAKLPGLGWIDVSFDQSKTHKVRFDGGRTGIDWSEFIRTGTFRGTISFRGEGGFTQAHASAAPVVQFVRPPAGTVGTGQPNDASRSPAAGSRGSARGRRAEAPVAWSTLGRCCAEPGRRLGVPSSPTKRSAHRTARPRHRVARLRRHQSSFAVPGPIGSYRRRPSPARAWCSPEPAPHHLEALDAGESTATARLLFGVGVVPDRPGFTARLCERRPPAARRRSTSRGDRPGSAPEGRLRQAEGGEEGRQDGARKLDAGEVGAPSPGSSAFQQGHDRGARRRVWVGLVGGEGGAGRRRRGRAASSRGRWRPGRA